MALKDITTHKKGSTWYTVCTCNWTSIHVHNKMAVFKCNANHKNKVSFPCIHVHVCSIKQWIYVMIM